MSMGMDAARFDRENSVDNKIEIVRAKRSEESVLEALKELSLRPSGLIPAELEAPKELPGRKVPSRIELFREVLKDPEQSLSAKNMVVVQLGTEHLSENQELLLHHLDITNLSIFSKVVHSLGKIGDKQALEQLEGISAPDDEIAKGALKFAQSLIAYRLRINRHLIMPPSEAELVKVTDGSVFKVVKAETQMVTEVLKGIKKELPAVTLAEDGAMRLSCPSSEMLLVSTDVLQQPESLLTIDRQNALPIVLLKKGYESDRYFLDTYFFTQPTNIPNEIAIVGVRSGGELVYSGKGEISNSVLIFKLKSANTRYAPAIDVEGHYNPSTRSWEFKKAISSTKVAAGEGASQMPSRLSRSINYR